MGKWLNRMSSRRRKWIIEWLHRELQTTRTAINITSTCSTSQLCNNSNRQYQRQLMISTPSRYLRWTRWCLLMSLNLQRSFIKTRAKVSSLTCHLCPVPDTWTTTTCIPNLNIRMKIFNRREKQSIKTKEGEHRQSVQTINLNIS